MTPEKVEETTIQNALAIEKLTQIAEQTTKDVDRVIKHTDKLITTKAEVENLDTRVKSLEDSRKKTAWYIIAMVGTMLIYFLKSLISIGE